MALTMANQTDERKTAKIQLPYGELTKLAKELGCTVGHLSHYFAGRRPNNKKLDTFMIERYGVTGADIAVHRPSSSAA